MVEIVHKKVKMPHHEQLELCTTRLPYRQGRKLTAIKVYTVNNESKHLLVFGVPALNLRQELKSLFVKFGKLQHIGATDNYDNELFTETYHIVFERIQSARVAKKKLDTNNFYGGILHICYAPELETVNEAREKLQLRKREVMQRLQWNKTATIQEDKHSEKVNLVEAEIGNAPKRLINMGEINVIDKNFGNVYTKVLKRRVKYDLNEPSKKCKPCFIEKPHKLKVFEQKGSVVNNDLPSEDIAETIKIVENPLNYNKFGNEVIKKYEKPLNRIVFNLNK